MKMATCVAALVLGLICASDASAGCRGRFLSRPIFHPFHHRHQGGCCQAAPVNQAPRCGNPNCPCGPACNCSPACNCDRQPERIHAPRPLLRAFCPGGVCR